MGNCCKNNSFLIAGFPKFPYTSIDYNAKGGGGDWVWGFTHPCERSETGEKATEYAQ